MNKKKFKIKRMMLDLIFFALLVAIDQLTKILAINSLKGKSAFVIWKGVFELQYLENHGAAFGMLQNGKVFFVFAAIVMITIITFVLLKTPNSRRYNSWHIFLVLIAAGGIGNMIDRLLHDYVVDFFYFSLINFPIFNMADIMVTFGTALLLLFVLFVWKEDDLKFISLQIQKEKKYHEMK